MPAENFAETLSVNIDNERLGDVEFRDFVRRTVPKVIFPRPAKFERES